MCDLEIIGLRFWTFESLIIERMVSNIIGLELWTFKNLILECMVSNIIE